ncbi:MAG: GTP pyrophosphokinase family protein [Lachnospiraceae bacterium]|nr:GTP pyrophosphokinase family protein [Lachnospiraceae bacterium]
MEENAVNEMRDKVFTEGKKFGRIMMVYNSAIKEIRTKLEVLNDEFQMTWDRNPIETIKSRIKQPMSIIEKLKRKGISIDELGLASLNDIAGVRVICAFVEDIYTVADMLTKQDDIKILECKDYIKNPKPNGYRSLHLVVEVPVFLSDRKQPVKVEVQIRTIAMDFWASLEHDIHYKKNVANTKEVSKELKKCADIIYATDIHMQNIRKMIQTEECEDKA